MTLEERIEAAEHFVDTCIATERQGYCQDSRRTTAEILKAAFPELFSDPPTGWIAPIYADGEMASMGQHFYDKTECGLMDGTQDPIVQAWGAMRHEYLSRHPMKPTEAKE